MRHHSSRSVWLRDNARWHELVPHLEQLHIKIVFTEHLPTWDADVADYESRVKHLWLSVRRPVNGVRSDEP